MKKPKPRRKRKSETQKRKRGIGKYQIQQIQDRESRNQFEAHVRQMFRVCRELGRSKPDLIARHRQPSIWTANERCATPAFGWRFDIDPGMRDGGWLWVTHFGDDWVSLYANDGWESEPRSQLFMEYYDDLRKALVLAPEITQRFEFTGPLPEMDAWKDINALLGISTKPKSKTQFLPWVLD